MPELIPLSNIGSGTRKVMEMALKERGFDLNQLNVTMELESIQAIKQVVSAGVGISIISSLTVSSECDREIFKTLKIQDALVYRPFSILTNTQTTLTKDEHVLINLLHDQELLSDILRKNCNELEKHASMDRFTHPAVISRKGQRQGQEQGQGH